MARTNLRVSVGDMTPSQIFKWPLQAEQRQLVQIPEDHEWLAAGVQDSFPVIWAKVDPESTNKPAVIRLITTGEHFEDEGLTYIGTVTIDDWFVGHIFEQSTVAAAADPIDPSKDREARIAIDSSEQSPEDRALAV